MSTARGLLDRRPVEPQHEPIVQDAWVPRFGRTERFTHWWTVLMLATALLSGLAMGDDSRSGPLLVAHAGAVVLIGAGVAAALIVGDHRALRRAARQLFLIDRRDTEWLHATLRHPLHREPEPAWGMFNTGQKLLAWTLTGSVVAVVVTGIQAWSAGGEGGLHGTAVAVTLALLAAHIFMAVVNPATRPALTGMVFGRVRRSWAEEHHAQWLRDMHT